MTDYFALLEQPRQPWIDPDQLEYKYRERARQTHPDQSTGEPGSFAEVNQAYRTLRNPALRLQHLLNLAGHGSSARAAQVPADLGRLFTKIATGLTSNSQEELTALSQELEMCYEEAMGELRQLNDAWNENPACAINEADDLSRRFVFLHRWKDVVDERRFITSCQ